MVWGVEKVCDSDRVLPDERRGERKKVKGRPRLDDFPEDTVNISEEARRLYASLLEEASDS